MKTKLNYYEEYRRIREMEEKELKDALMRFPDKEYEFVTEEDAEDDDFWPDGDKIPIIPVENEYNGSCLNIVVTKVCIVRDTIEIWGFDEQNEGYGYQVCYTTWQVAQGNLHWLIDYLPEPPEPQETPETKETQEKEYTYKEMENAVHLSADLFMNLYEKWGDMMSVASFLIEKASELDKNLGGRDESEGNYDYVDELEKFEKKILAEL